MMLLIATLSYLLNCDRVALPAPTIEHSSSAPVFHAGGKWSIYAFNAHSRSITLFSATQLRAKSIDLKGQTQRVVGADYLVRLDDGESSVVTRTKRSVVVTAMDGTRAAYNLPTTAGTVKATLTDGESFLALTRRYLIIATAPGNASHAALASYSYLSDFALIGDSVWLLDGRAGLLIKRHAGGSDIVLMSEALKKERYLTGLPDGRVLAYGSPNLMVILDPSGNGGECRTVDIRDVIAAKALSNRYIIVQDAQGFRILENFYHSIRFGMPRRNWRLLAVDSTKIWTTADNGHTLYVTYIPEPLTTAPKVRELAAGNVLRDP